MWIILCIDLDGGRDRVARSARVHHFVRRAGREAHEVQIEFIAIWTFSNCVETVLLVLEGMDRYLLIRQSIA